jgi:hypothetical protein
LPQSLQKSAKLAICRASLTGTSGVDGMRKAKFASLGQTGMHLPQVRQSKSFNRRPIFRGTLRWLAAW